MERPYKKTVKRYVMVSDTTYQIPKTHGDSVMIEKDTSISIVDTINRPCCNIDGRLYALKNIDKTGTFSQNVYECLGTIQNEFDDFEVK